jgi:hypothetical protein
LKLTGEIRLNPVAPFRTAPKCEDNEIGLVDVIVVEVSVISTTTIGLAVKKVGTDTSSDTVLDSELAGMGCACCCKFKGESGNQKKK